MEQLKKDEELAARRLAEIEAKKEEASKKHEAEYRARREQIVKFAQFKEATELQTCREAMKSIEVKLDQSTQAQKALLSEKVKTLQEHNEDILRKRQLLSERRFEEWMQDQEGFFRHLEKIEKKVQAMEKKMQKTLESKKDKQSTHLEMQHHRKMDEEYQAKQRAKRIMEKFETSGKQVEQYMQEQAHELMLK